MASIPTGHPEGSPSPLNGPRATRSSPRPSSDKMPATQPRDNPRGLQDAKAQELEQEFKTRHIGVLGVLAWIL